MAFVQFLAACLELGLVHIALFGGIEIEDGYPPAFLSVILPVVQFHHEAVVLNFPLLVELEHLCVLIGIIRLFPAFRLFFLAIHLVGINLRATAVKCGY